MNWVPTRPIRTVIHVSRAPGASITASLDLGPYPHHSDGMGFAERLAGGTFPVSLEVTPPRTPRRSVLLRRARLLGTAADAVNVIQRPDRQSSVDASIELLAAGVDPVWHLAVRGRDEEAVTNEIRRGAANGLRQVLCLLGDHPAPPGAGHLRVRDAIAIARRQVPTVLVGATLNQYVDGRGSVLRNLLGKLEAGAAYVQTQPVFDVDLVAEAVRPVKEAYPGVRVIPMVMPLLEPAHATIIAERLGISLPPSLLSRIAVGVQAAWWAFDQTVVAISERRDLFDGIAVMTFETDPDPGTGASIAAALRRAGIVSS